MTDDPKSGLFSTPEHSWSAAAALVFPVLRPAGMIGRSLDVLRTPTAAAADTRPLLDPGPVGLVVAYVLRGRGYDILVNGDHLAAWYVPAGRLRETADTNLHLWSRQAAWTVEQEGSQVLLSSDTGEGLDAARILLPEVRDHLVATLAPAGARVLVGIPTVDLLVAAALADDDPSFAVYLARFVASYAEGADDPLEGRLLELRNDELIPFVQ